MTDQVMLQAVQEKLADIRRRAAAFVAERF